MDVLVLSIERWIHFLSGVTWIGLLYYFNFVQVPAIAAANADAGGPGPAAINKYVAPRALVWFRWGAVVTWLSGAALLESMPHLGLVDAFTLQGAQSGHRGRRVAGNDHAVQRLGSHLAEPEEGPGDRFRDRRRRTGPVGLPCWLRERTRCCRFPCCCSWGRLRTSAVLTGIAARFPGTRANSGGCPCARDCDSRSGARDTGTSRLLANFGRAPFWAAPSRRGKASSLTYIPLDADGVEPFLVAESPVPPSRGFLRSAIAQAVALLRAVFRMRLRGLQPAVGHGVLASVRKRRSCGTGPEFTRDSMNIATDRPAGAHERRESPAHDIDIDIECSNAGSRDENPGQQ